MRVTCGSIATHLKHNCKPPTNSTRNIGVLFKEGFFHKSMKKTKEKTAHGISDGVRWVDLRINIYRGQNNANGVKNGVDGVNFGVNELTYNDEDIPDQIQRLLKLIAENPTETQAQYAEKLGVSKRTISRFFMELKGQGILEQQGNRRKAKWIILKKNRR